jgi:hypothetical protein
MTKMRSQNELHLAWNVPTPSAGCGGEADSTTPQMTIYQFFASTTKIYYYRPEMFQHQVRVVVARPILQPPKWQFTNFLPLQQKFTIASLKCSSARCGSWWRGWFCNPPDDNLPILCLCSKNLRLQAWNVLAPGAGRGGEADSATPRWQFTNSLPLNLYK